jgi:hypothetical protein
MGVQVSGFDLRSYLERFPEVCRAKFGRTYNFRALEKDFAHLRSGGRWLAARDVMKIFEPPRTPFARYWPKPNEKELNRILSAQRVILAPVLSEGRPLVERLLAVFHNIGLAALVLRFVHPQRFGIFSTPIVSLLQIHRPGTVELYLAFCEELIEWQEHFRLASVAETETALWTFHEISNRLESSPRAEETRAAFDADVWIQRRRIAQALRPFLEKYGPLELARLLAEEHPKLAGKVAGEEYERLLRLAAHRHYRGMRLGVKGAVEILFNKLEEDGLIRPGDRTLLNRTWKTRNDAVHPFDEVGLEEVENMIDTIERICRPWDTPED